MQKKLITASDVMNVDVLQMEGLATIAEALKTMKEKGAEVVIVKKRDEHDALGILLLSDIAKEVLAKDKAPERVNIYEIMSKPVLSIEADLDVRYCARMFDRFGLANAPVVKNGEVMGIVSYRDLVFRGLCELID